MIEEISTPTAIDQSPSSMETIEVQSELSMQTQRDLTDITNDILSHKGNVVQSFIEIGRLLIEAKEQLTRHGQWLDWLSTSVDISERMAQRYMQLAKAFSNPTSVTDLGMTKALALLPLPDSERQLFIEEPHEVDGIEKTVKEMSTREVKKAVRAKIAPLECNDTSTMIPTAHRTDPYSGVMSEVEAAQESLKHVRKIIIKLKDYASISDALLDSLCTIKNIAAELIALINVDTSTDIE